VLHSPDSIEEPSSSQPKGFFLKSGHALPMKSLTAIVPYRKEAKEK
jgi:hypothetical protein